MSDPFIAEVRVVSFTFAPKGWAFCNGQLLPISQNQALFSILGTTYGGDGITNFALPNLQGKVPFHFGNSFTLGQSGGEATHTLSTVELPAHNHLAMASSSDADQVSPSGNFWAKGAASAYSAAPNNVMSPFSLALAGASQAHQNLSPFLVLNFIIALQGIFPTRN
jgi:microcystin-dependent protein